MVGVLGEKETKVRDLGHLAVELGLKGNVLGEEVIVAGQAELTELRDEISGLNEQLEVERAVHAGEIESLKREHNEELLRLQREHDKELAQLRIDFEELKRKVGLGEEIPVVSDETEPETPSEPAEAAVVEESRLEEATPGGPVVVDEVEERRGWWPDDRRGRASVIAASLVLGAVLWEVVGERIFGFHDGGVTKREITNIINEHTASLKHQEAIHHAAEMKQDTAYHMAEMKAIANARHDELQAIHGVYKEVSHDHQQEMKAIHGLRQRLHESDTFTGVKFAVRYPWDWAANKVGIYRATPYLHELAARAATHGHKVQWIFNGRLPNGARNEILKIDGTTNSRRVISVLNQQR